MKRIKLLALGLLASGLFTACHNDLDQTPYDPDIFSEIDVYANEDEALSALAKVYASLSLTGQQGPAGQADIAGIDEGTSQFTRMLYNLQELTTDHCVVGWGDPGLPNLHGLSWGAGNDFTTAMYYRLAQVVSFSNSFIQLAEQLESAKVDEMIAEARFIRAYAYYNLMDLYGDVPLVTQVTTALPEQSERATIFAFVESELKAIETLLPEPRANEYGRVDRAAAWALLSRLYLNAEVYIDMPMYAETMEYSEKVINSGYALNVNDGNNNGSAYDELFLADNDTNGAQNEFLFVLTFDGLKSQTYGGTTFMVHAPVGGEMDPAFFGVNGGWNGYRGTKALVEKFNYAVTQRDSDNYPIAWGDGRARFFTQGQNYEIETIANTFEDGYAVIKYRNVDVDGNQGSDAGGNFADCDMPVIRLGEIYLNYAEAAVKGGGNTALATDLINELRDRAGAPDITATDLTAQFILDERSRELHWEGLRRTDLIRYGQFVSDSYLWPFKGGAPNGVGVEDFREIYPLPSNVLAINPNLTQNPGY